MLSGGEAVKDHAALGLADALDDDLLGGLGGNASEGLGLDLLVDQVAEGAVRIDPAGGLKLDLGGGGDDLVHDLLLRVHPQGGLVELYEHVVGIAGAVLFISGKQGLRDLFDHVVSRDAALALKLLERCEDFGMGIVGVVGCHDLFLHYLYQSKSALSRTRATWDLENVRVSPPYSTVTSPLS